MLWVYQKFFILCLIGSHHHGVQGGIRNFTLGQHPSQNIRIFFSVGSFFRLDFFLLFWTSGWKLAEVPFIFTTLILILILVFLWQKHVLLPMLPPKENIVVFFSSKSFILDGSYFVEPNLSANLFFTD